MRRVFVPAALVVVASCGGGPIAPSTAAPVLSLATGAYLLTVEMSTSGTSGFSTCVSQSIGGQATPAFTGVFVPMPVQVDHSGSTIVITPDDAASTFRMQLQQAGANVTGTASGQFHSTSIVVTVAGRSSTGTAAVIGIVEPTGPLTARGTMDGTVSVQGLSCTNNGHNWTLSARS